MPLTRELTPVKKRFADEMLKQDNASRAVRIAYQDSIKNGLLKDNENNIGVKGNSLLKDPKVVEYLQQNAYKAGRRVVELIESKREDIALRASQDTLDRVLGRAKQSIDVQSLNIEVTLSQFGDATPEAQTNRTLLDTSKGVLGYVDT